MVEHGDHRGSWVTRRRSDRAVTFRAVVAGWSVPGHRSAVRSTSCRGDSDAVSERPSRIRPVGLLISSAGAITYTNADKPDGGRGATPHGKTFAEPGSDEVADMVTARCKEAQEGCARCCC